MAKRRKIEITIRTDRRITIYATGFGRTWCERCGSETEVISLQTAGMLANSMLGNLPNGALPPELHFSVAPDGTPRVCLESLMQMAARGNRLSGTTLPEPNVMKGLLPE